MNVKIMRDSKSHFMIILAVIVGAIIISLFLPWESGGESWGYWYFSKLLLEGEGFIISGRSPVYTLYLLPFTLIPYPLSMEVAYVITVLLCVSALFVFLRKKLGDTNAVFFSILWIPFIQQNEPAVQVLALACVCFAYAIRLIDSETTTRNKAFSYALLILAILFRPNFGVFLVTILIYDFVQDQKKIGILKAVLASLKPFMTKVCACVFLLMFIFAAFPVAHKWSNAWLASDKWFPESSESLGTTSVIGHYNWRYIEEAYGSFEGKDIYFTHQEAFSGATSVLGMIRSNPSLFTRIALKNAKIFLITSVFNFPRFSLSNLIGKIATVLLLAALVFGSFRASSGSLLRIYVISSFITVLVTSIIYPKLRYMLPLLPVFALSAWWYGLQLQNLILHKTSKKIFSYGTKIIIPTSLLLFSWYPAVAWTNLNQENSTGLATEKKLESRKKLSMKTAFEDLSHHSNDCKGIMALEHNFFAAFVINNNLSSVYDIWEIPPFGEFANSEYSGLNLERIDCLFISYSMEQSIGMGTNVRLRYDNYVHPYEKYMLNNNAVSYSIPSYGRVIKYKGQPFAVSVQNN